MIVLQYLVNGIVLGGLYASIAAGFSLVWGVLNIINILHGTFIVLGAYVAFHAYNLLGIHPFISVIPAALLIGAFAYVIQALLINRVVAQSVLVTLTLTFGIDLVVINAMLIAFTANFFRVTLPERAEVFQLGGVFLPPDRAAATLLALLLTLVLWSLLRLTRMGRAIVAVRFDREAASLMGVDVHRTYAITFALGAALAAAAGALLSSVFPMSPLSSHLFLSKAFVICVMGGIGSIPGAAIGGFVLGLLESFGSVLFGAEHAVTVAFVLLILLLIFRRHGIMGIKGYD
ncbi:MAG: branched-chain amino acid ABC transporter permease [Burkholderiales bacterium]|nr:branched-chain amino acid ABC transporter permease [Burkholderiales bacterium]